MRRASPLVLAAALVAALAGCGGSSGSSTPATAAPSTTATTPTTTTAGQRSPYVVVTSLLGKRLAKEPGCAFAKTFTPLMASAGYDGSLMLTVTCARTDDYTPTGQIVNRAGSTPTEITCRDTNGGQLFCIYVPSSSVGIYFTGTDRAVVRRRLEHLTEVVAPLPTGITPLPQDAAP